MTPEETLATSLKALETKAPTAPTEGSPEEDAAYRKGEPESTKPVTLRNLFTHPDAHPVVLDFALQKSFQEDWFRWTPETTWFEIQESFSTQLSELCRHKIRALQVVHVSKWPWKRWNIFEKVAQALNSNFPDFQHLQKLSLPELYASVDMLQTINKEQEFEDEVKLYMAATVLDEDIFYVPPPLDFIQMEVAQPHYLCKDCGNTELALFHDGVCSNCTDRMNPTQKLSMQPLPEKLRAGMGKNVVAAPRFDWEPIAKRWDEVKGMSFREFQPHSESREDMQCAKLLLARDYMNLRRKQLAEQITNLKSWLGAS